VGKVGGGWGGIFCGATRERLGSVYTRALPLLRGDEGNPSPGIFPDGGATRELGRWATRELEREREGERSRVGREVGREERKRSGREGRVERRGSGREGRVERGVG
jgi:hypothetical protein